MLIIWAFVASGIYLDPFSFHHQGASVLYLVYMILAMLGLYDLIRSPREFYLEKSWFFWFVAGILIYGAGSFLLFLFRAYLLEHAAELFYLTWHTVFQVVNIIKNIMIGLALSQYKTLRREPV